ncbi:MAG: YfcE family phosphodiesterase [Clostridia bacterium]|nr:YfcE family phosphodiesterase [Clostridia bacterium]
MKKIKILVFSDSHGREKNIEKAIEDHGCRADALIFLGDGLRGAENVFQKYPHIPHLCVKGNCDGLVFNQVDEATLDLGGIKILCMHGHLYDTKSSLLRAGLRAREVGASLLLFGHTHAALEMREEGLVYFNPGTIGLGYPNCTYGVIEIIDNKIVCGHGTV